MNFIPDEFLRKEAEDAMDAAGLSMGAGVRMFALGCLGAIARLFVGVAGIVFVGLAVFAPDDSFRESVFVEVASGAIFFLASPYLLTRARRSGYSVEIILALFAAALAVASARSSGVLQSLLLEASAGLVLFVALEYVVAVKIFEFIRSSRERIFDDLRRELTSNDFVKYRLWQEAQRRNPGTEP